MARTLLIVDEVVSEREQRRKQIEVSSLVQSIPSGFK